MFPVGVEMPGDLEGRKALLLRCGLAFIQTLRQCLGSYFSLTLCLFQTSYHYKN